MFLNKKILISLFAFSLAICIAGTMGVSIEQVQFIFFPLILLHFALLVGTNLLKLPAILVTLVLVLGYFSSMKTRGMLSAGFYSDRVYLISDGESADRKSDRKLFNKFNQMAEQTHSRRMRMIFRDFGKEENLKELASKFTESKYLLSTAEDGRLEIVFPKNIFPANKVVPDKKLEEKIKKYGIDLEKVSLIEAPSLGIKLLLGQAPEVLTVSSKSYDAAVSYLFYLQKIFSRYEPKDLLDKIYLTAQSNALAEDSTGYLASINGAWSTPEPAIFAKLIYGTRLLIDSANEELFGQEPLRFASEVLFKAIKSLQREKNLDLSTLVRNNFAISRFLTANSSNDYHDASEELKKAVSNSPKNIPLGSKIAMLNLEIIQEAGLED